MQSEMMVNLLSSILIALIPFVIGWLTSRIRRETPQAILDLIGQRNAIVEEIAKQQGNNSPGFIICRLEVLLKSVDQIIQRKTDKATINEKEADGLLFKFMTAAEGFLFIGSLFTFPWVKQVILGFSYESNVYFLEGIFKSPVVRLLLIALLFTLSFIVTIRINRKWSQEFKNKKFINSVALLAVFNVLFVLITLIISYLLAVLDPIVTLW